MKPKESWKQQNSEEIIKIEKAEHLSENIQTKMRLEKDYYDKKWKMQCHFRIPGSNEQYQLQENKADFLPGERKIDYSISELFFS